MNIKPFVKDIGRYFNLMADKEDERQVIEQVSAGVVFRGTNLWILIFAIFIASLGLNVNSTAVIIGAMLVSPLMGPIIGLGLSVGIGDYELMKRALKNYAIATLISVITAAVYFLLSPINDARSELLARTSPSLYDVLIAFCGGAAGVLALTTKSKGQVIPGVAIATALMPPLCTAGYGLATAQWSYFFGAFYLFFINTVFIALATFFGVKLLRFHTVRSQAPERAAYGKRLLTIVVVVTLIPAAFMTVNIVRQNVRDGNVKQFADRELGQSGTLILSSKMEKDTVKVVAIGRVISEDEISAARSRMDSYGLKGHPLMVIQGTDSESLETLAAKLTSTVTAADAENRRLTLQVADLERQLAAFTHYDTLAAAVSAEAMVLFPGVERVEIGRVGEHEVVHVWTKRGGHADRDRLTVWLRTRLRNDDALVEML